MKTKLLSLLITLALLPSFVAVPVQAQTHVTPDEIQDAIDAGVAWLVEQQDMYDSNLPEYGSWGGDYSVGVTGLAVLKLEDYAFEQGKSPFDDSYIYKPNVEAGLNFISKNAVADSSGVHFVSPSEQDKITYETGICMMAIAASRCPCKLVEVTGSDVNNWTYKQVLCDAVDYLAFAQCDDGGWYDLANYQTSNNPVAGYVVMGLQYAEDPRYCFSCAIPDSVKTELSNWIDYVQCKKGDPIYYGGSGYETGTYTNYISSLKTGCLLSEMAFVNDKKNKPRVEHALGYIQKHWYDTNYKHVSGVSAVPYDQCQGWGWGYHIANGGPAFYQAAYLLTKGLQSMGIADDEMNTGTNPISNWYQDLADVIVPQQQPGGSWPDSPWSVNYAAQGSAGEVLSTIWALLTLERAAPPLLCDCQGQNPVTVSWIDASGNSVIKTGHCEDTLTIASVSPNTAVKVSTSENCTSGCALSQKWTVTNLQGTIVKQGDGTTASFIPVSPDNYTVTFNATCGRGCGYEGDDCITSCPSINDNICQPCTIVISVGGPCPPGCNCEWRIIIFGCNPPQKCSEDPCDFFDWGVIHIPKYCYPEVKAPPPCQPVINNFDVHPAPSFGSPCIPGANWNLSWDVAVPAAQNIAWPAPGDSDHPVYIDLKCTDSNNNVKTYWGPEAFEKSGNITYTLPADFLPCGKKCEFCLWSYDCHLNKVMECQPMCENVTVTLSCPGNCSCFSIDEAKNQGYLVQDAEGWHVKNAQLCKPKCGCDEQGNPKICLEIATAPTPCPGNCDCLTETKAIDLGYTNLCQQEPCSAPGEPQKFCYSRCPEGCSCVTEEEADELGYTISCSDEICDSSGNEPKYCFSPPLQPCSDTCQCLTQAQANEYGYTDAQRCQTTPCQQDQQGTDMYCYPKPKAPVVDVTADHSFVTAGEQVNVCWKVTGIADKITFAAAGDNPVSVDPVGCKTFRPTQQTRYLVTAKNAAGSGQDAVTVGVGQPPPVEEEPPPVEAVCPTIVSFTANCPEAQIFTPWAAKLLLQPRPAAAASLPQTCTLSWLVTGPSGTTVNISGIGTVGMSGSTQVPRGAAPVTVTYTLTATYGSCVRTATVQVP